MIKPDFWIYSMSVGGFTPAEKPILFRISGFERFVLFSHEVHKAPRWFEISEAKSGQRVTDMAHPTRLAAERDVIERMRVNRTTPERLDEAIELAIAWTGRSPWQEKAVAA